MIPANKYPFLKAPGIPRTPDPTATFNNLHRVETVDAD